MVRVNMRRIVLLMAMALALVAAAHAMRRERPALPVALARATEQPAASPRADALPVIRFAKNPELAPPLQARDLSGAAVSKANWSGKVVLVNFWATWCPPCREEIPEMIALQKQYKDRLQIIGISEDDDSPETVLKFAQQKGINYPIVMYTPELVAAYGGVPALPTTFVIDTQGRVVTKHAGLYSMDSYIQEIRALLGQPVEARIETFADTGQLFLKNAANATELPGVNLAGLTPEQKKAALHRLNAESCTCGCNLTLSQCRVNDTECPVSGKLAAQVVKRARALLGARQNEVVRGDKPARAPVSKTVNSNEK
jgi:thiol-disulfide isomerase/thioredoxin